MSPTQPMLGNVGALGSHAETDSLPVPAKLPAGIVHDLGNLIQIVSAAVNIVFRNPCIHAAGLGPVIAGAKTSLTRASMSCRPGEPI